jgi:hypothetical protein
MLPTNIQPFIVNVSNLSPTTSFPAIILDTYDTLSPVYNNTPYYFSYIITIIYSTPPNQIFQFAYIDINAVVQYFSLDGTIFGDSFTYIGQYPPTFVNNPTSPYAVNNGTSIPHSQPIIPNNTPYSYQNNQNIVINMNPNMKCNYKEFLEATMINPFKTKKTYISSNNPTQISQDQPITIFYKDSDGNDARQPFIPFVNPYQSSNVGVVIDETYIVDGFTGLKINSVEPLTNVQIYFYPVDRFQYKF